MINYKDNKRVLTAEELRHMYNLDDLKKDRKAISIHSNSLTKIEAEQENVLKSIIINLGDSINDQSEIALWFFDGTPTLNNVPASDWNDYSEHLGDFYYDKSTGLAYKFVFDEDYLWQQQNDSSLIQALALTNSELDTIDSTRKVFFSVPKPPYTNGDWYIDSNYDLYICQISKSEGEIYNENDFIIASRYTDDTKANEVAGKLVIVSGQVTTIIQNLDIISQTIEDNRYYIDEKGEKHLISTSMSQLVQTVDGIKGEISDIADITITSEGNGSITAENINESEPIFIKVHATSNENYSFLYPEENLYPGANTFTKSRTLLFENSNGYSTSYEIPNDLLYLDENTYDEFVLDYEEQKCYIVHRVGINENNENYKLTAETTEYFDYPEITLQEGNYTISTPSGENTYIYVRLMTKNIYTSQFATQIEMNAKIEAKANEINLEVSQKVDNKDYTNAQITALINDGKSSVKIKADKIDLAGYVTVKSADSTYASKSGLSGGTTTINGGCITTGTIDASKVTVKNLNADLITSGTISVNRLDSKVITTDNFSAQTINANKITTGTIDASKVTVKNLNASNIISGTLTADKISGGTISTSAINLGNGTFSVTKDGKVVATSGSIGGWSIGTNDIHNTNSSGNQVILANGTNNNQDVLVITDGTNYPFFLRANGYLYATNVNISGVINATSGSFTGSLYSSNGTIGGWTIANDGIKSGNSALLNNGNLNLYPSAGGTYRINNGVRLNATSGVQISSNGGSPTFPSSDLNLLGLNGASVYMACRWGDNGSERSAVTCADGALYLATTGVIYANGVAIGGSSSRATKENIIDLSQENKDELYKLIKNIPLKQYDYKSQYGKKNNYGFIIEDIEDTKLNDLLHIVQNQNNKDIKNYSSEDLTRLELVVIQELMKKVEKLEELICQ